MFVPHILCGGCSQIECRRPRNSLLLLHPRPPPLVLNLTCSTYTYNTCSRSLNLHSLTYAHMISHTQFTHKRSHTYSHSLNLLSLTFKHVHNLIFHFLSFTYLLHSLKCAVGPPWGCLRGRCSTLRLLMLHCVAGA